MTAKVTDLIVGSLVACGVEKVFGVVGTSTMDIIDAVAREPRLEFVSARSEEAAAHMADGFAKATGNVGVCLAHVGPGALRQAYGVGTSWKDGTPILVLTGNEVRRGTEDTLREGYHVVDHLALYESITKAAIQLRDGRETVSVLSRALWLAASGRPGPVLVDLPKDVIAQEVVPTRPPESLRPVLVPASRPLPHPEDVAAVADALADARQPVLHVGAGAHWSGAEDALRVLAEEHNLAVVTSDGGRGALPEDHALCLGVAARQAGDTTARQTLAGADVVLNLGIALSDVSTFEWNAWHPEARLFRVDIDAWAGDRGIVAERTLVCDLRMFCSSLREELARRSYRCARSWDEEKKVFDENRRTYLGLAERHEGEGVSPWALIGSLEERLPRGSSVSVDSGLHSFFGKKLSVSAPRTYIRSAGFGAMGYSFPAMAGAAEDGTDRVHVAVTGDGCLAMCLGELETVARRNSRVVVVLFNDATYSSQFHHQSRRFEGRAAGTRFTMVDFAAVARAHGVSAFTVEHDDEVDGVIERALAAPGPVLIDARIDRAVVPDTWIEGSGDSRI